MKIIQVINTNTVLAEKNEEEVVLMGKNIGFKKRPGEEVDQEKIEKVFKKKQEK